MKYSVTSVILPDLDVVETCQLLQKLGYDAITVSSGHEGLNLYRENQRTVDLIILDMVMPDMGGEDIFKQLRSMNPDVNVIISSGYSMEGKADELIKQGCRGFLQKPFNLEILAEKLHTVLN